MAQAPIAEVRLGEAQRDPLQGLGVFWAEHSERSIMTTWTKTDTMERFNTKMSNDFTKEDRTGNKQKTTMPHKKGN